MDEQPEAETQTAGEQPIGLVSESGQAGVPSQTVQPAQEPPDVSAAPVFRCGIETPRGSLTRKAMAQHEHFNPRKSPKQGMGL